MKLHLAIITIVVPVLLVACHAILGIEDDGFYVPAPDAGPQDRCAHRLPPPAPDAADGVDDARTFVFALEDARFGRAAGGYDLDDGCTCNALDRHGGVPTCRPPKGATVDGGCDEDGGVDNAFSVVFDEFALLGGLLESEIPRQAHCGRRSLLVILDKYNGLANDPDVLLTAVPSFGIWERAEGDAGADEDAGSCPVDFENGRHTYAARADGTDRWSLRNDAEMSRASFVQGWVSNYELVFDGRRSGDSLLFAVENSIFRLRTPILSARLVPVDERGEPIPIVEGAPVTKPMTFRLADAILTGRALADDVVSEMGRLRTDLDTEHPFFCQQTALYASMRDQICRAADVVGQAERDSLGDPCNALSLALQFSAAPAQIGEVRYDPSIDASATTGCAASGSDDTCAAYR